MLSNTAKKTAFLWGMLALESNNATLAPLSEETAQPMNQASIISGLVPASMKPVANPTSPWSMTALHHA
jgi:hypothetical protein